MRKTFFIDTKGVNSEENVKRVYAFLNLIQTPLNILVSNVLMYNNSLYTTINHSQSWINLKKSFFNNKTSLNFPF